MWQIIEDLVVGFLLLALVKALDDIDLEFKTVHQDQGREKRIGFTS
ncbi:MAG: hypothetical protein JSV26_03550 [bacterium]|nr:MAG: hypothetical protein JSV26_03550 [bacterium]